MVVKDQHLHFAHTTGVLLPIVCADVLALCPKACISVLEETMTRVSSPPAPNYCTTMLREHHTSKSSFLR